MASQAYLQQLAIAQNNPNDPTSFLSPNLIGDFNDQTIDGSGYGLLTGAAQMQTYYAYYNAITSTAPEIPDQTAYFIKYLIDKDGNVVKPQPGEVSAINLKDNFETGKIAISTARKPTVLFSDLLGEKEITHVGEISTILVSNTGSLPNQYVTTMSFEDITGVNLDTVPADFNFSARAVGYNDGTFYDGEVNGTIINDGVFSRQLKNNMTGQSPDLTFQVQNSPDITAGTWNGSTYTFNQSTINGKSRVKFRISLNLRVFRVKQNRISNDYSVENDETSTVNIQYKIYKNGSLLASSSPISVNNQSFNQYPSFTTPYYNFQNGDQITFFIEFNAQRDSYNESWPNRYYDKNLVMYTVPGVSGLPSGTSVIEVINENQNFAGDINGINIATAPYWYISEFPDQNGDANAVYTQTSVITASLGMSQLYRPNIIYRLHPSCSAYGYSRPWQTYFELLPGDKIIFENNKFNTHTITEIITTNILTPAPEGSASFGLRLSPGVPTGSIIDNFCIYRIIDNGTYIVLNQPKPDISGSLQGFLLPKYITPELSDSVKDTTYRLDVNGLLDQ